MAAMAMSEFWTFDPFLLYVLYTGHGWFGPHGENLKPFYCQQMMACTYQALINYASIILGIIGTQKN